MGDRVAVLKDGLLQQVDSPRNMYDRPANLFVAGFIGSPAMNLVEVPITDGGVKFGNCVVPVPREALKAAARQGRHHRHGRCPSRALRHRRARRQRRQGAVQGHEPPRPVWPSRVNVVEELGADGFVYGTAEVGGETRTWSSASAAARCRRRAPSARRAAPGRDARLLHLHRRAPQRLTRPAQHDSRRHPPRARYSGSPRAVNARRLLASVHPVRATRSSTPLSSLARTIPRQSDQMSPNHH